LPDPVGADAITSKYLPYLSGSRIKGMPTAYILDGIAPKASTTLAWRVSSSFISSQVLLTEVKGLTIFSIAPVF